MKCFLLVSALLFSSQIFALEVIKPVSKKSIILKIVRAIPDGFETISLTNHNGREMTLVCANNRAYEFNKTAMIEYRNFYNEHAGNFTIDGNQNCLELARFIERTHHAIDEERPFIITLNTQKMSVEKIVYPNLDQYSDKGNIKDLFPKSDIRDFKKPTIKLD